MFVNPPKDYGEMHVFPASLNAPVCMSRVDGIRLTNNHLTQVVHSRQKNFYPDPILSDHFFGQLHSLHYSKCFALFTP